MNFRTEMKADIWWRIIDIIGHILLAIVLPGHWWYQFLPDIFVPFLFIHGIYTRKLLPANSKLLKLNCYMHGLTCLGVLFICDACISKYGTITETRAINFILIHFYCHIIWDIFTHHKDWNKKRLWI